jgi:hypothetical protein
MPGSKGDRLGKLEKRVTKLSKAIDGLKKKLRKKN